MTRQLLDQIDAAVQGQCACGCGALITVASPSAYFASYLCSVRWHHARYPQPVDHRLATVRPDVVQGWIAAAERVSSALAEMLRLLTEAFAPVAEAFNHLHIHLWRDDSDLCSPEPAPRHGPVRKQRPPRSIAPSRGWRLEARGR